MSKHKKGTTRKHHPAEQRQESVGESVSEAAVTENAKKSEAPSGDAPAGRAAAPATGRRTGLAVKIFAALALLTALAAAGLYQGAKWAVNTRPIPYSSPVAVEGVNPAAKSGTEPIENPHPGSTTIIVRDGDTSLNVAAALRAQGYDLPAWLMKLAARMHPNTLSKLHKGRYRFPVEMTPATMLDILSGGALIEGVIRIPDGAPIWEVRKIFNAADGLTHETTAMSDAALAEALGISAATPEGYFAPETYHYMEGVSDLAVMKMAVKRQKSLLASLWEKRSGDLQVNTPYEALILASIIEKESGLDADRGKVASVFHNRLSKGMPLQTDPTVIYGLGPGFSGNLTRRDLASETPYNTYRIAALPPTPIGSPGVSSLTAALNPERTAYLYFVSRGDGTSEFTTNLNAHNRAVNRYILNRPRTAAKKAAQSGAADKTGQPEKAADDKADKADKTDSTAQAGTAAGAGVETPAEKSWKAEKSEKSEKAKKSENADKADNAERPVGKVSEGTSESAP